jgi:hypothetical protein
MSAVLDLDFACRLETTTSTEPCATWQEMDANKCEGFLAQALQA